MWLVRGHGLDQDQDVPTFCVTGDSVTLLALELERHAVLRMRQGRRWRAAKALRCTAALLAMLRLVAADLGVTL